MKINYELNNDSTIKCWQSIPFDEYKPFVEISDNEDIVLNCDKVISGEFIQGDRDAARLLNKNGYTEFQNKVRRAVYFDAYRKYQAAVNYGEFLRVPAVDSFISCLRNKDWDAYDNIPSQIMYFTGEIGLTESGLTRL